MGLAGWLMPDGGIIVLQTAIAGWEIWGGGWANRKFSNGIISL